jgi:antitoxin CptB
MSHPHAAPAQGSDRPDPDVLRRLRWRCRRGLLENDLFIARFFDQHGDDLTVSLVQGLLELMDLSDNDLMDLLLVRKEPEAGQASPEMLEVLQMMRVGKA